MTSPIRLGSIQPMFELVQSLKHNNVTKNDVLAVLAHDDYDMEFKRYNGTITKEEFCDYFLRFPGLVEHDVKNPGLRAHHRYFRDLYDNLEWYQQRAAQLMSIGDDFFLKQIEVAQAGLPHDIDLSDVNFVFTIGIGQSFGYTHESSTHYDMLQLAKDHDIATFQSTIAHEVHHVGFKKIMQEINFDAITLEELFYIYFAGEGLAVKYCNNAEGVLSNALHPSVKNIGLDAYTWRYLTDDFETCMDRFHQVIRQIRGHEITTEKQLVKELRQFWMNPYIDGQPKDKPPRLKHFRLYSFGNEIWGIIHDRFGKDKVYATLRNISDFPGVFNHALHQLNRDSYAIR